jgi:hypothetical protein
MYSGLAGERKHRAERQNKMNIQEIENTNHELGSFSNESTAAFTSSVSSHNSGEIAANKEAREISNKGNIALVISEDAYCKHTDAIIGSHFGVEEFDTVAEALGAVSSSTVKVVGKAKTQGAVLVDLGEFVGETVVVRVDGKNLRHNRSFTDKVDGDTGAFFLYERVYAASEINLEHWRELDESEAATFERVRGEIAAELSGWVGRSWN